MWKVEERVMACSPGTEILASHSGVKYSPSQASVSSFVRAGSITVTASSMTVKSGFVNAHRNKWISTWYLINA